MLSKEQNKSYLKRTADIILPYLNHKKTDKFDTLYAKEIRNLLNQYPTDLIYFATEKCIYSFDRMNNIDFQNKFSRTRYLFSILKNQIDYMLPLYNEKILNNKKVKNDNIDFQEFINTIGTSDTKENEKDELLWE